MDVGGGLPDMEESSGVGEESSASAES
jgi:hypothetical protein